MDTREKQKHRVRMRRIHRRRMIRRAYRIIIGWSGSDNNSEKYKQWAAKTAIKCHDYMAHCSCAGCGNPRRHFGVITFREQKGIDQMMIEMEDFNPVFRRFYEYRNHA